MLPYVAAQNITFHHLTTDEGLSHSCVTSLYKDEMGFIWAGTHEGLNRFNGYAFRTYKSEKDNAHSLSCNSILRIDGNQNGKIYILTIDGLEVFDMKSDRFDAIWDDIHIKDIHFNKRLYVAKGNEIYTYNEETSKFSLYYRLPTPDVIISTLYQTPDNSLCIGTENNGLYRLENGEILFHPITGNCNITSILCDSQGVMWIGTLEHGLFRISNGQVSNLTYQGANKPGISSNYVRTCCEDNQGNIWIGTFDGLSRYHQATGQITQYKGRNDPDGLTNSSIWCIIKDHQGTLWLGTYFGGINYFNPEYEIYTWYKASAHERLGLSFPVVGQMTEDKHKNLWICTQGGGVNVYNPTTRTFRWYRKEEGKNSLSGNYVNSIYYDKEKDIMWIGNYNGLNRLDLRTDKFTHYRNADPSSGNFFANVIRDIEPYNDQLILATADGVYIFDPSKEVSHTLFPEPIRPLSQKNVYDVCIDHQNKLWISAFGEGVYRYDFTTKLLINFRNDPLNPNSLCSNEINRIVQDSQNNLYFCSAGAGLDIYRYTSNDFENFDSRNSGLSSDCVYEVRESNSDELLVTTNQGFSTFDKKTKLFRNYGKKNGFPLSAINEGALYITDNHEIFLGGMRGMVSFDKRALNFTKKPYNIILTRLYVNNKEVTVNDDTDILQTSLPTTPEIILNNKQSTIIVEYALTNYIAANEEDIVYQLEGFSNEWTSARGQHYITYTKLNPGYYTLRLKSSDPNNHLVNEARLRIRILPPIYRTTTAYLLYIGIFLGITFLFIHLYTRRLRQKSSLEYEHRRLQDAEELSQAKLQFFTHVSHEFRTPLTLIIGQMETLLDLQLFTPAVYKKLSKVYNSSLQLKELISELLDFRRQDQGHMHIYVSEHNIVDFLYANYLLFEEYATSRNIHFTFEKEEETILVWYDERQMQKVMNNLLSNAFKFTPPGKDISIHVRKDNDQVIVEVSDTGIGIPEKYIGRLFERFFQIENPDTALSGTGIGLPLTQGIIKLHHGKIDVESVLYEGSVFRIALPLGKSHFTEEELALHSDIAEYEQEEETTEKLGYLSEQAIPPSYNPDKQKPTATILVVEDNAQLRVMLAEILGDLYQVITADDGREGWEKVKAEMPNLVLSDIVMPHMTGIELCKAIKDDIETCHIPVALLTAKAAIKHNIEGLRIGADDYITKPFNVPLLVSRCNNLINSRIMLQEKFSRQPQATPQILATNALDKTFLDKAMKLVEENLENSEYSVNDFASGMGMSRTKLFNKLKAVSGQSPNDFITTVRLQKAVWLLCNKPELNIMDISTVVGFSSPRYFSKCFKDTYHIRPLDYRRGGLKTPPDTEQDLSGS